jgi:streptomycin 6-kinase
MEDGVRFPVPDIVRRRALSEGIEGERWLATLDTVLTELEHAWHVQIGQSLEGGTAAFVAEAIGSGDERFVIKLPTPASAPGRQEAAVLAAAAGKGYARLIRHDPGRGAMLLERLGPRLDTFDLPHAAQLDILCSTLLRAWIRSTDGAPYINGRDKANSLAMAVIRLQHALGQPCSQAVIDTTLMYCRDRAAAWHPESAVLAHGDPHPANLLTVIDTDPLQFRFIDPDGLAIEPAYDLGVLLREWHEGVAGPHAHDLARSHARHLTTRTQVPTEPIWQWGYIERVSTGLHLMELGELERGRQFIEVAEAIQVSMPR